MCFRRGQTGALLPSQDSRIEEHLGKKLSQTFHINLLANKTDTMVVAWSVGAAISVIACTGRTCCASNAVRSYTGVVEELRTSGTTPTWAFGIMSISFADMDNVPSDGLGLDFVAKFSRERQKFGF